MGLPEPTLERRAVLALCPHHPPLHPDGFRPPKLFLPGLVEFGYDLLCLLGGDTEQSEVRGQAEGR